MKTMTRPISERTEQSYAFRIAAFTARITAERRQFLSPYAVAVDCAALAGIARSLGNLHVHECNVGNTPALDKREARLIEKARAIVAEWGPGFSLIPGSGDPRGCALLVGVPSGAYDTLAGNGIAVPER